MPHKVHLKVEGSVTLSVSFLWHANVSSLNFSMFLCMHLFYSSLSFSMFLCMQFVDQNKVVAAVASYDDILLICWKKNFLKKNLKKKNSNENVWPEIDALLRQTRGPVVSCTELHVCWRDNLSLSLSHSLSLSLFYTHTHTHTCCNTQFEVRLYHIQVSSRSTFLQKCKIVKT